MKKVSQEQKGSNPGKIEREVYQVRRAELSTQAEFIESEIKRVEQLLQEAEMAVDDGVADAYARMKMYDGENQLSQKMVQELIEKVLVYDPEHVEIVWKFSDEVMKFIVG